MISASCGTTVRLPLHGPAPASGLIGALGRGGRLLVPLGALGGRAEGHGISAGSSEHGNYSLGALAKRRWRRWCQVAIEGGGDMWWLELVDLVGV